LVIIESDIGKTGMQQCWLAGPHGRKANRNLKLNNAGHVVVNASLCKVFF